MQEYLHLQEPPTAMEIQESPVATGISINLTQEDVSADTSSMEVSEPGAEIKVSVPLSRLASTLTASGVITDFASSEGVELGLIAANVKVEHAELTLTTAASLQKPLVKPTPIIAEVPDKTQSPGPDPITKEATPVSASHIIDDLMI